MKHTTKMKLVRTAVPPLSQLSQTRSNHTQLETRSIWLMVRDNEHTYGLTIAKRVG